MKKRCPLYSQALAKELNISWSRLLTLALRDFIRRCRKRQQLTAQINAAYAEVSNEAEIRVVQGMRSTHRYLVKDEW